jgi:hypothetical protein
MLGAKANIDETLGTEQCFSKFTSYFWKNLKIGKLWEKRFKFGAHLLLNMFVQPRYIRHYPSVIFECTRI